MNEHPHSTPIDDGELAQLAALADGSLAPERADALRARVAASPELTALLAEQQRVVDAVRAVRDPAPARLRATIERQRTQRERPRLRVRLAPARLGFGFAAAAAALAVALVLALPSGQTAPTVADAATLAQRAPALPAPPPEARQGHLLRVAVDGVHFPYWEDSLNWRTAGLRNDTLQGRTTATVFYRDSANQRIGYTIVGGRALSIPAGSAHYVINGVALSVFTNGSRTVVTWQRSGHTCVLSGVGVPRAALLRLAAWRDAGAVTF